MDPKPIVNRLTPGAKKVGISVDQKQVIHVAEVGRGLQLALNEMIQSCEIDVRAELTGEISDRKAPVRWLLKPAFGFGDQFAVKLRISNLSARSARGSLEERNNFG